jgi:hypothetical protein
LIPEVKDFKTIIINTLLGKAEYSKILFTWHLMFGNPKNVGHDESSSKAKKFYVYQKSHCQTRNTRLNNIVLSYIDSFYNFHGRKHTLATYLKMFIK